MISIRECKKEVREFLRANFKFLLLPAIIFCLVGFLECVIVKYFLSVSVFVGMPSAIQLLILLVLLAWFFLITPITRVAIFRIIILLRREKHNELFSDLSAFLTFKNIGKIFLFHFIPSLLDIFFTLNKAQHSALNFFHIEGLPLIIMSVISFFISYKFFAAEYCFALKESAPKETILASAGAMRGIMFKFLGVIFAYFHLVIAVVAVVIAIRFIVFGASALQLNLVAPFFDSFASVGFGLTTFVSILTFSLTAVFADKLLNNTDKKTKKENKH